MAAGMDVRTSDEDIRSMPSIRWSTPSFLPPWISIALVRRESCTVGGLQQCSVPVPHVVEVGNFHVGIPLTLPKSMSGSGQFHVRS